ncbi:MAG: hypothetical protein K2K10_07555, partial [Acetatifactor sp.]|nr:hypothetical protein [Acetatifactor sp.]
AIKSCVKYRMQFWNTDNYRNEEEKKQYQQYEKRCMAEAREQLKEYIYFHGNHNIIVSFWDTSGGNNAAIVTTVVHTTEKSSDSKINSLIEELNGLYHKICNIKGIPLHYQSADK